MVLRAQILNIYGVMGENYGGVDLLSDKFGQMLGTVQGPA